MRSRFVGMAVVAAAVVIGGCGGTSQQTANDVSQGPGHGADKSSLFRSVNLAKALDSMKSKLGSGGQVTTFKLEPASIKSEVQKDGKDQTLIINSKFDEQLRGYARRAKLTSKQPSSVVQGIESQHRKYVKSI